MIGHLTRSHVFLKLLRLTGAVLATLGLGFGLWLPDHFMTFLGAWSAVCAFNSHRYLTGGTIVAPGTFEFATPETGNGYRLFVLILWWLLLLVFFVATGVGRLQE
jgi:hypothetical protein